MYNTTIFVGMDVHKETFSLCCYSIEKDEFSHPHKRRRIIYMYFPILLP